MSYGVKYRLITESIHFHNTVRVDILKKDYDGDIIKKKIGEDLIKLNKESNDSGKIRAATLDVCIQCDENFEYLEFFTLSRTKFLGNLYVNDDLIFTGYILSDEYEETYKAPPYDVSITFSDGLGLLTNYDFELTGMVTRLKAIYYILNKVAPTLDIAIACDLFEDRNSQTKSFFSQVYYYANIHYDENCEDVLNWLLPFGCEITQSNARWVIRRDGDEEKEHFLYGYGDSTVKKFDSDGNPIILSLTNDDIDFGNTPLILGSISKYRNGECQCYPISDTPKMSLEQSKYKCTVVKNFGKRDSIFKNYDFTDDLNSWTLNNLDDLAEIIEYSEDDEDDDYNSLLIKGCTATNIENDYYIKQSVGVVHSVGDMTFSFDYAFKGRKTSSRGDNDHSVTLSFKWQLKFTDLSGNIYYLHEDDDNWAFETLDNVALIKNEITGTSSSIYTTNFITFSISNLYASEYGTYELIIYRIAFDETSNYTIKGLEIKNVILMFSDTPQAEFDDPEETTVIIRDEALTDMDDIDLKPVDLPVEDIQSINDSELFYENGNYVLEDDDYAVCTKWTNNGNSGLTELNVLQAELLKWAYPRQKLEGTFRGESFSLNCIITHPLNYNRKFYAISGTWNIIDDVFESMVMREIYGSATDQEWILKDGSWNDQGEWIDDETWNDEDPDSTD